MVSLEEIIMAEHSKAQAIMIADIIIQKPELLGELLDIIFTDKEPISRRAAWPLRFIHERNEKLIISHLPSIIGKLAYVKSVSVQRSLLYILAHSMVPEEYHGELLQYASELIMDTSTSIASLIYSIDLFFNISKNEPDLLNELSIMIEQILPYGSAGVKSKARKTLIKIENFQQKHY